MRTINRKIDIGDKIVDCGDWYVVSLLSHEDIESAGFDPAGLTDEKLSEIACRVGNLITETDFWSALDNVCTRLEVPHLDGPAEDFLKGKEILGE